MFYDKQSNNQVLRMQTMHTGIPIANEAEELRCVPDDMCYRIFIAADGSQVLNLPSSTLSHLDSSSSTNANAFPLTKARHSIPFPTFILTVCSPTPRSLFYSAQSNLPITRHLFRPVKPSGNSSVPLYPDLPNSFSCQLTAVYSLQASLDVLRKHRPDYTPRTGFVWPIIDPSLSDDTSKPRKHDPDAVIPENDTLAATPGPDRRLPKREQNNILLLNAMRTTAAHSRLSYTPITTEAAKNGTAAETPVPTQTRSSVTPAPGPQEPASKGSPSTATVVEITKGTTAVTKKKKKRMSGLSFLLEAYPHPRAHQVPR